MTSVETVRTIPIIRDKDGSIPMEAESIESGFPFDRDDRDDSFRTHLDDLANRHPEFAEHLGGFPFRSDSLGRRFRQRPSDESFGRPFGSSRFERFGFPFNRDPFDDFEEPKQETPEQPQQKPQETTHQQQEEKQTQPPERGRKQNIQQSNTVDLGQKQEPVNDRNQRSMSAPPPDNRQRYTSSIHIPINREGGMADMGTAQSQPQQQQQEKANKPTERVIPIHVEGRDEPVMPKHAGPTFTQQQPQPERIFGHRPSQFTQFVGREPPRQYTAGPEWHHQGFGPEVRQQKFQQQAPPPQQQPKQTVPPQKQEQQAPPEPQPQPQPQQQAKSTNPIDIIQSIQKDVSELMSQVEKFSGAPRDKQYLYLDEMLTRNLIKLDNIDTQGQENIRQARKEAIKCIESCIGILEAKAAANVAKTEESQSKEEETPQQPPQEEKMEVEIKPNEEPKPEEKKEAEVKPEEKMEVAQPTDQPPVVEEKMEVVAESTPVTNEEKIDEKPTEEVKESNQSQTDTEMRETPEESKKSETTVEESNKNESVDNEDKKEKKKEKKKVVKK